MNQSYGIDRSNEMIKVGGGFKSAQYCSQAPPFNIIITIIIIRNYLSTLQNIHLHEHFTFTEMMLRISTEEFH